MSTETIKVWDIVVRLFHWSLVAAFLFAFASGDELERLHVLAGYYILVLLLVRVVWGFIGSRYARFSSFVTRPAELKKYLGALSRGQAPRSIGHNPAGGWMILAMLVALLLTGLSGMALYGIDENAGPLAFLSSLPHWTEDVFEELHEFLANSMMVLVFVHVLGVMVSSVLHGENLVKAMWTGRKQRYIDKPVLASSDEKHSH